jgi:magnesium transporter
MEEIVNCALYTDGRRTANIQLKNAGDILKQTEGFVWIGLHEPQEETLQLVQQEFGLHDLAIEDAHRAHQRPKVEIYGNSVFIVLRTAQINSGASH